MLAWIGNLLIVVGLWKIGDKWRHAFLFSIAGELAYIARSVAVGDWALAFICVVFCAMALRSWIKWGRDAAAAGNVLSVLWVRETVTSHWLGRHGGEAVQARLRSPEGVETTIVLANHSIARSFGEALIRHADQISRPSGTIEFNGALTPEQAEAVREAFKKAHTGAGVASGRERMGPRSIRKCAGPPLCRDQHCDQPDGHA